MSLDYNDEDFALLFVGTESESGPMWTPAGYTDDPGEMLRIAFADVIHRVSVDPTSRWAGIEMEIVNPLEEAEVLLAAQQIAAYNDISSSAMVEWRASNDHFVNQVNQACGTSDQTEAELRETARQCFLDMVTADSQVPVPIDCVYSGELAGPAHRTPEVDYDAFKPVVQPCWNCEKPTLNNRYDWTYWHCVFCDVQWRVDSITPHTAIDPETGIAINWGENEIWPNGLPSCPA
jgi:ribosomal protein L37AE/L43A